MTAELLEAGSGAPFGTGSYTLGRRLDVGLCAVASRLPRGVESVDEIMLRAERPSTERKMFTRIFGLRDSPTLSADESMEDLLVEAGRAALAGGTADLVLYGHTMLMAETDLCGGFPDRLRAELGLAGALFYGVSHINCASVLRCVEYADRFLSRPGARPDERVLVLGGDQGSVADGARVIKGTTVSGDGAVGVVVQGPRAGTPPRYRCLAGAANRDVRFHRNIRMTSAEFAEFARSCSAHVLEIVRRAAAAARLRLDELDWVLPHLNNKMFWKSFSTESGIPMSRISLDLMQERGHNFGADSLMVLEHAQAVGRLKPGDRCAMVAIGQGAYFQAMVIEVL